MRIATLQFSPRLGQVAENMARADELLAASGVRAGHLDLLVLPELAFTGYNFPSLAATAPHLERTASGPSSRWAARTAARLACPVTVGYPEKCAAADDAIPASVLPPPPPPPPSPPTTTENYNATVTVAPDGRVLAHYRKTHLYYTDASWAQPSPAGFQTAPLPLRRRSPPATNADADDDGSVRTAFAICMDLNPRAFRDPTRHELAAHVLAARARLLVASMAWLARDDDDDDDGDATAPDMRTVAYWLERLGPLVSGPGEGDEEVVVVVANRSGVEPGAVRACGLEGPFPPALPLALVADDDDDDDDDGEGSGVVVAAEARYAGSSCVLGLRGDGRVRVYGVLGRAEEAVLVADTGRERTTWVLETA